MAKFVTIGERLSTTAPAVNKAFTERDPEPIIKRAKQQLDAGIIGNTAAVAVGGGKMLPQLRNGFSQQPVPIKGDLGKGTVYLLSKLIQPGYIHADQIILAAGGRLDHPVDIPQRGQDRQLQVDAGGFLEMRRQPGQSGGRGGGHGQYS